MVQDSSIMCSEKIRWTHRSEYLVQKLSGSGASTSLKCNSPRIEIDKFHRVLYVPEDSHGPTSVSGLLLMITMGDSHRMTASWREGTHCFSGQVYWWSLHCWTAEKCWWLNSHCSKEEIRNAEFMEPETCAYWPSHDGINANNYFC